jgi:predicted nucleic acid-binding Zn ribbon protein
VDAAPLDLYRRDPVAFLLYASLYERPRVHVTLGDVQRITGSSEKQAKTAIRELVGLGALAKAGPGLWRPANAPVADPEVTLEPVCRWCQQPLPPGRRVFCSDQCSGRANAKLAYVRKVESAGGRDTPLRCGVCGTDIPRRPRSHHQVYCSRKCARVVERQAQLERDVAAGTAGVCETCGGAMRADATRWCSRECRPRSRGGLHPDGPAT